MLLTDWLKVLTASGSSFCAPSRPTRRQGASAANSADISSQPETLEKRTLLSAADILLTDVSGATGFQVDGEPAPHADGFGNSMRAAGDVNGDGFGDVIIGAYYQNDDALDMGGNFVDTASGVAYVLFGKSTGFSPPPDLNNLQASDGFRILGSDRSDTGTAVSGGGDINGDGFDDLVVASPNYSRYTEDQVSLSSSYVIFGKANNTDVELSNIDQGASDSVGFRLTGFKNSTFNTRDSISTGGDINGDGFDDVVFGAPQTVVSSTVMGAAYVVFGKENSFANLDVSDLNGTTGFTFTDSARGYDSRLAYIGAAVSLEGDVNGDGFDDLVVGAPGQNKYRNVAEEYDGEVYVIFGRSSFSGTPTIQATSLNGSSSTGFAATGLVNEQARTGSSVGSGGDVNGDGIDDLVIGAPGDGYGYGTAAGRAYVVFGKTNLGTGGTLALESLSGSNGFVLRGGAAYDVAGTSVSINGDVNGDGFDDVVVGAPTTTANSPSIDAYNGAAYVVFGKSSIAEPANLDALDGVNGFALKGTSGNYAGQTVAIAGDLDGDGFDEVLIGEPRDPRGTVTFFFGEDFDLNDGNAGDGELGNGRQQIDGAAAGTLTATQGNSAADILVGGRGNDTLNADGGSDVLIGGSGDDILAANLTNFSSVPRFDGGTGVDTLTGDASFSGATINLTAIPGNRINDIEVIDLEDGAIETLTLDLASVIAITGSGSTNASSSPFATDDAHTLAILRDSDDTINIGAGWTQGADETIDGKTFEVFTQAAATVKIQSLDTITGDVDGDNALTTTDNILVILIATLSVPDSTIDARKGGSALSATEIRDNVNALAGSGELDVDGNGMTETTDSILVILINTLSVPDGTIDARKAADSPLTAAQIRTNVTALIPPPSARLAQPFQAPDTEESDLPVIPLFQAPPPTAVLNGLTISADEDEPAGQSSDEASNSGQNDTSTDEAFVTTQIDITMGLLS
jgi:hypothetical protein